MTERRPAYGSAMVGCGEYKNVNEVAQAIVRVKETVLPDAEIAAAYA